jgi:hypothetical protein
MNKSEERRYVGMDLGKRTYEAAFFEGKKVVMSNGRMEERGRRGLYKKLRWSDWVALEGGGLAFIMAKEMEKAVGCRVFALTPGDLAIINKSMKKTDKEDAKKLGRMLRDFPEDSLPEVSVPSDEEIEMRELTREREQAIGERTRQINQLHSLF